MVSLNERIKQALYSGHQRGRMCGRMSVSTSNADTQLTIRLHNRLRDMDRAVKAIHRATVPLTGNTRVYASETSSVSSYDSDDDRDDNDSEEGSFDFSEEEEEEEDDKDVDGNGSESESEILAKYSNAVKKFLMKPIVLKRSIAVSKADA